MIRLLAAKGVGFRLLSLQNRAKLSREGKDPRLVVLRMPDRAPWSPAQRRKPGRVRKDAAVRHDQGPKV